MYLATTNFFRLGRVTMNPSMKHGVFPHISVMPQKDRAGIGTLSWGLFFALMAAAVLIAMDVPIGPITLIAGAVAVFFAFTYPYATFGLLVGLIPFLGVMVHVPVSGIPFGERIFGGSIDILFGEVVAIVLLLAWALKVILLWVRRHDVSWKPWLPLAIPMGAIVFTHVLSAFSPLHPDAVLVLKYALRPVLWSYLVYVALTVNMVRSPRRLRMVLGIVAATGVFAALMGFASFALPMEPGQVIPRARPLPLFGTHPLGENHNLLAEWLSFSVMATLALIYLTKSTRLKRLLGLAAFLQVAIALLTFARSLWIVMAFQAAMLAFFVWREQFKRYASIAIIGLLFTLPLGATLASFSTTQTVQSSNSSRLMLTDIALNYWSQSPFIGAGAGTYVDLVARSAVFFIEYGNPMDSHGWIQKLLAEVGLLGLAAVSWLVIAAYRFVRKKLKEYPVQSKERAVILILSFAAAGALIYQLFNTNYWTGKLWFPLGILLAATRALKRDSDESTIQPIDA